MRRVIVAVGLSVALVGCGSSNNNTSNPVQACQSLASTVCTRFFACDNATATTQFGTVAACTTTLEADADCSTAACATGKTFNSNNAQTCLNDINAASCTVIEGGTLPTSCASSLICQ